jgi:UDP-N-acetylmuramoyl-tripeptide--D-alanyl-D-alanine ligase
MAFTVETAQLPEILGAKVLFTPAVFPLVKGVSTDTRTLQPQQIFVALRGEQFDGHEFLQVAQEKGAGVLVVDRSWGLDTQKLLGHDRSMILQVEDTLAAYQRLGQWWRQQFVIPIVGVTGSVGKTTTKEFIAAVLGTQGAVLKTEANYNNEIGVPKTLLELGSGHTYGVIEMAMRGRGEIALLGDIVRPTIGVITNVGVAHIERLGSRQAIAAAKCELLAALPADGVAVLNADNPLLMETAAQVWQGKTVTFGLTAGDVRGELTDLKTLTVGGQVFQLPLPGEHNGLNFLAALAVAEVLGLDKSMLRNLTVHLPGGRSRCDRLPGDIILLDETYNAGPESMTAALKLLAQTPGHRHIAVLGTMKELGENSLEFHTQVGQMVAQLQLDYLLILADEPEAQSLATGAGTIPSERFTTHEQVATWLQEFLREGDRVLFKASRSVALDKVVDLVRFHLA